MSLPKAFARLALGTLGKTLDAVALVIFVPLGLILSIAIAGFVFAPVLRHLQEYWWVYLLALLFVAVLVVYLASGGLSRIRDPALSTADLDVPPPPPQVELAGSELHERTLQAQPALGRPTSGKALFRFTEEWLTRNGLYEGRDMSKSEAIKIAGRTAIAHHLREGNFVELNGRIALTAKGFSHFANRRARL